MRTLKKMGLNRPELPSLLAVAAAMILLAGCGNTGTYDSTSTAAGSIPYSPPQTANPGASTGTPTGNTTVLPSAPIKEYAVEGYGNHNAYVCIPSTRKLQIRVIAHGNAQTIDPWYEDGIGPVDASGKAVYPLAGNYTKLRVRVKVGTQAWDFDADNESKSVIGDFSPYLTNVDQSYYSTATSSSPSMVLGQLMSGWSGAAAQYKPYAPEKQILGSTPWDGLCTFHESRAGKCSLSSYFTTPSNDKCPAYQQKVMITYVQSDFPCFNDTYGWCKDSSGNQLSVATVMDYQHWSVTIQAATETTVNF